MNIRRGILLLLAALMLTGCAEAGIPAAPETTVQITDPAPEPSAEAEPQSTEPREPVLHSGLRPDGTFGRHALFLGDSLTFGLVEHEMKATGVLGEARYAGKCGAHVGIYSDGTLMAPDEHAWCYFSEEFRDMTMPEVLRAMGGDAWAIYYMFGTNFDQEGTARDYIGVLDDILEACPQATVYLQTVPQGELAWETVNSRIREAYDHYADEPRVQLLDIGGIIGRHVIIDGVHQTPLGRQLWVKAIQDYAAEHHIGE